MIGRTIGGKYAIVRRLGEGGMGAVYEARHSGTGRRVAIKVITADLARDPQLVARFEREALAAGAIESEHIVQVFDVGTDEARGEPFLAMELLVGEDVQQLLSRLGPLPPDVALRIGVQACQGLAKAHEVGIVHRDIKPANLFLAAREGGDLIVKVLDFGIAKMTADELGATQKKGPLTQTGTLLGSPLYMSPEQSRSKGALDHRTDIWSLGIVLYQALSGRTPFDEAESLGDFILAVCTTAATPLRKLAPWVDAAVAQAVQRALAIEPADRYQTAAEMREALAAFLPDGAALRASMLVPAPGAPEEASPDTQPATPFVLPEQRAEVGSARAEPRPRPEVGPTARSAGTSARPTGAPTPLIPATLPGHPVLAAVTTPPIASGSRAAPPPPASSAPAAPPSLDPRASAPLGLDPRASAPIVAPIVATEAPPRPEKKRRAWLVATGVVLAAAAGSLAAVYELGWLGDVRPPRRTLETPSAPADPPPRPPPQPSLHSLSGTWWTEGGVAYEGIVTGASVELRVRDPEQLPGLGYSVNEAAFVLRPIAAEPGSFRVNARIRPPAPHGSGYDHARAAASCIAHWTEVSGKQLKAAEVMDRLILQTVKIDPTPSMFVHEGTRIVGCNNLADARAVESEIVLGRQPVTSPVPRWTAPLDAGAHDAGTHTGRASGAPCLFDVQCASRRCLTTFCR